jgi:hypothetical protein
MRKNNQRTSHHAALKAIEAGWAQCLAVGLTCDGVVTGIQIKHAEGV